MSCLLFKLSFDAPVHFGPPDGALSLYSSEEHFRADTLFSALCHTALRTEGSDALERLCSSARGGQLRFSDAMPWRGETLYLPKPFISAETAQDIPAQLRKAVKKLKWIPVPAFEAFSLSVRGGTPYVPQEKDGFGIHQVFAKAAVSEGADAMPYEVGTFRFFDNCGLWFLCFCRDEDAQWLEKLVASLGHSGIGGKISSGYGSFHVEDLIDLDAPFDGQTQWLAEALHQEGESQLLLTTCLPDDDELDDIIASASYQLVRRSGFIQSETYSHEPLKKETQVFLAAGSVVKKRFRGTLFEVGNKGAHPVLRYSQPVFLGVSL